MEKKFKADNGVANVFWIIVSLVLLGMLIYRFVNNGEVLYIAIYFGFTIIFILSTTIKEYVFTENGFLEVRFYLRVLNKNRRIPIGDMVAVKRIKHNQVRIDKVRGFEMIYIKPALMDAFINEIKEQNPRIIIADEKK